MKVALGCTTEEEYADGLAKVADELSGSVGLLFTSKDRKEVEEYDMRALFLHSYPNNLTL